MSCYKHVKHLKMKQLEKIVMYVYTLIKCYSDGRKWSLANLQYPHKELNVPSLLRSELGHYTHRHSRWLLFLVQLTSIRCSTCAKDKRNLKKCVAYISKGILRLFFKALFDPSVFAEDYWFLSCYVHFSLLQFPRMWQCVFHFVFVSFFRIQTFLGDIEGCKMFQFGVWPGKINTFGGGPINLCADLQHDSEPAYCSLSSRRLGHHTTLFMLSHMSKFHLKVIFFKRSETETLKVVVFMCLDMC